MANERLARATITIAAPQAGGYVELQLDGQTHRFTAVNQFSGYNVAAGEWSIFFVPSNHGVELANAIRAKLVARGNLPYTVSSSYNATTQVSGVTVEAAVYDPRYNFGLPAATIFQGLSATAVDTVLPVVVTPTVTPATQFGFSDGAIALAVSGNTWPGGLGGTHIYAWADDVTAIGPNRTNLAAGTYACTVQNIRPLGPNLTEFGAYTTVQVVVGSDPRLDVLLSRSGSNVTLVATGGLAPYTYLWAHGPTTASLQNLPQGTYSCTVTDARGATRVVTFTVDAYRFYWSQNPVLLPLDAGDAYRLDPTTKPNLSFVCQVWVEPTYLSGVFEQVGGQLEQPADRDGRTVFDVQVLLDVYLSEHLPALDQAVITRADALFRRFYLKYAEKYGDPVPVAAPLSTQAQHYVVLGGLDSVEAAAGTWFDSYQAGAKPFLTWEPNRKHVLPAQPEYLYFMVDSFALPVFHQRVRRFYADGTSQDVLQQAVAGAQRYEVYCLPAGYQQLGLAPGAGVQGASQARCVAWEVYVTDPAGAPVSEVRRYLLDERYHPTPRFFLYTNSLGGVNTLAALGEAKRTLDVKTEEADRPHPPGYDPLLGDVLTLSKTGQPTLAVSTGPRGRAQLVADQELALSPRVTMQSGGRYWAGRLKAKILVFADEAEALASLEFEFLLLRERLFTPRLPITPAGRAVAPVAGGEGAQP